MKKGEQPATDPRELAALALEKAAASGDIAAAKLLADGLAEKLRSSEKRDAVPLHGEKRADCPNCRHRLLVRYDSHRGYVEIEILDLTTMFPKSHEPPTPRG